jgi:hypothetical protein
MNNNLEQELEAIIQHGARSGSVTFRPIVINWLINNHIIKDKNQINMNEKYLANLWFPVFVNDAWFSIKC